MLNRGKLVVSSIFMVALLMAVFAWWWNYERGRKSMEFWGRDAALLIRQAKDVELLRLIPVVTAGESAQTIDVGPVVYAVERADISRAPGLLHARFALTEDASFEFYATPENGGVLPTSYEDGNWQYAVRFNREGKSATVLFDFQNSRVGIAEEQRSARVIAKIVTGWQQFIARHLPP